MAKKLNPSDLLEAACSGNSEEVINLLLQSNCKDSGVAGLNVQNKHGETALFLAVYKDHIIAIQTLVRAGADINFPCKYKRTPLMLAVLRRSLSCTSVLIQLGADIHRVDSFGRNALMLAAVTEQEDCLALLMEAGADFTVQAKCEYNGKEYLGPTALIYASESHAPGCLKILVQAGVDVNVKTEKYGFTALLWTLKQAMQCMYVKHPDVIQSVNILLDAGADVNVQTSDGETALMGAIMWIVGCRDPHYSAATECMRILLDYGADVKQTQAGETTLLWTVKWNPLTRFFNFAAAAECLKIFRDVKINKLDGKTALMTLVSETMEQPDTSYSKINEHAEFLLDAGIDVNVQTSDGETELMILISKVKEQPLNLLLSSYNEQHFKTDQGTVAVERVKFLLDVGADITITNNKEETLLMYAAKKDCLFPFLPLLAAAGAAVDQQDSKGMTALTHALHSPYISHRCVRWLVDSGASVNICDYLSGRSPLHFLMSSNKKDDDPKQCLDVLLHKQADVNVTDNDGITPLMDVARNYSSRTDIMAMFLQKGAELNVLDNNGQSALIHALAGTLDDLQRDPSTQYLGHPMAAIRFLLDKGASFNIGHLAHGQLSSFTALDLDLDLIDLKIAKDVNLEVSLDCFESLICEDKRRILLFLIINGVMPYQLTLDGVLDHDNDHENLRHDNVSSPTSVLEMAVRGDCLGITKYLIATCYLRSNDPTCFNDTSLRSSVVPENPEVATLMENLSCQPWPLVKLCFVAVSTALGASPMRQERIKSSQLPPKLQRMFLFQEPWSRLCVHQWDKIPLTFSPEMYEELPQPRPLLYHWPVGRALIPCDCGICDGTMYTFEYSEEV